jgi:subtilisin family serine protease
MMKLLRLACIACLAVLAPATEVPPPWLSQIGGARPCRDGHVYLLDTGVRYGAPNVHANVTFLSGGDGSGVYDCHGHGTQMAYIVSVVAPRSRITSVKVTRCTGSVDLPALRTAVDWLLKRPPGLVLAPFAFRGVFPELDAVVGSLTLRHVVVCAAGNFGSDACGVSPGRSARVITVGALGKDGNVWAGSCRGRCVDVYVPGVGLRVPLMIPGVFTHGTGTSYSAAIVAGMISGDAIYGRSACGLAR